MVDLSAGEGSELLERANFECSKGLSGFFGSVDEWKGSGMKTCECKISIYIYLRKSSFWLVFFVCFCFWIFISVRMTSDLSRTGPVERDIEQVYIYIFVLSNIFGTFSSSSRLASDFNFPFFLVCILLIEYCLLVDFVFLCSVCTLLYSVSDVLICCCCESCDIGSGSNRQYSWLSWFIQVWDDWGNR